jgi:hypothetical protein
MLAAKGRLFYTEHVIMPGNDNQIMILPELPGGLFLVRIYLDKLHVSEYHKLLIVR